MTWRTHVMGGLASLWMIRLFPFGIDSTALALSAILSVLGSLLPDLDARESKLSNVQILGVTPLKPVASLLYKRLGHRGAMHSALALIILSVLAGVPLGLFLSPFAGLGLALGYLSHILLDASTKSGVPLYWPDSDRVHVLPKKLRFVTGSFAEDILFFLLALVAAGFFLTQFTQLSQTTFTSPTSSSFTNETTSTDPTN
jgi:inner membrane protein